MGAGPTPEQVRYHMQKARKKAEDYSNRTLNPCTPRLIRASNGEAAIVYDVYGRTYLSLTEAPQEKHD